MIKTKLENKIKIETGFNTRLLLIETYRDVVDEKDWDNDILKVTVKDLVESGESLNKLYTKSIMTYITEEDIQENIDVIDLDKLAEVKDLSYEFIYRNREVINFDKISISNYMTLNSDEVENIKDFVNWDRISLSPLDINFIRKFKNNINWDFISANHIFTKDELLEFIDMIEWGYGRYVQNTEDLPDEVIEVIEQLKVKDKVNFLEVLAKYQELSIEDKRDIKISKVLTNLIKDHKFKD